MKKIIKALTFVFVLSACMWISASAEVIGSVLTEDIGAVIDGAAVKTCNVQGRTFVVAEDLRGYGFDVVYDDASRALYITQNPFASPRTLLPKEEVNIYKSSITSGLWQSDIFATDIVVYLEGQQIEAYAIDGRMVIPVRALEPCAYIDYNDARRLITVSGLKHYLEARHQEGNPNVTYETTSYEDREYYWRYGMPGKITETDKAVTVTETNVTYTEGGKIVGYWGNPTHEYTNDRSFHKRRFDGQKYEIYNTDGNLIYESYIDGRFHDQGAYPYPITESYLLNDTYYQKLKLGDYLLYGYEVEIESAPLDY